MDYIVKFVIFSGGRTVHFHLLHSPRSRFALSSELLHCGFTTVHLQDYPQPLASTYSTSTLPKNDDFHPFLLPRKQVYLAITADITSSADLPPSSRSSLPYT